METTLVPAKEIKVYEEQVASASKFSQGLEVKTKEDYEAALIEGKSVKAQLDAIVARKEIISKPLYASYKSVLALFKPLEEAGEKALKTIKTKMLAFTDEQERKADEAKQKLAERVERGTMKPETAVRKIDEMTPQATTVKTEAGSATTKTVKKWRVVDKAKIPLMFMEPDMTAIKKSFRDGMPVPGVEEYEEKELSLGK